MKFHEVAADDWLSIGDVAEVFNVTERIVRADIKAGKLPYVIIGSTYRIPGHALLTKMIDAQQADTAEPVVEPEKKAEFWNGVDF